MNLAITIVNLVSNIEKNIKHINLFKIEYTQYLFNKYYVSSTSDYYSK